MFASPTLRILVLLPALAAVVLQAPARAQAPIQFRDVSSRLDFEHLSMPFGGDGLGGAAWFDYDQDGDLDLYMTNGKTQRNSLFENDGTGHFKNVAAKAGVANGLGNSGVVAADIDNDGFPDLLLTGDGGILGTGDSPVVLYHNQGDGAFVDITATSGVVGSTTSLAAALADINNDGFLDIFITAPGSLATGKQHRNKLFLNNGDLTFTDISASSGVDTDLGACVAFFSDYDNDGWIDLFVADCNDVNLAPTPIELFRNNHDNTFTDVAAQAKLDGGGFWMGFGPADYDNDGDIDLYVTNLGTPGARARLYENQGNGTYSNVSVATKTNIAQFGWGVVFRDFDNDGFADIFFAGALPPQFMANPGILLFNDGNKSFVNHSASLPVNLAGRYTSGVAGGDFDGDGFEDLLVVSEPFAGSSGHPVLLRNMGNQNGWVNLRLQGTQSNRDAVGARIRVTAGSLVQTKEIYAGSSFASTDSLWQNFGLASQGATDGIEVRWPSGLVESFPDMLSGSSVTLVEGTGCLAGVSYCGPAVPNSSGLAGEICATGSLTASDGDLTLMGVKLAVHRFGYLLASQTQNFVTPPGSQGNLCLGGNLARFTSMLASTGSGGTLTVTVDTSNVPTNPPAGILAGDTWNFQFWFRDANPSPTSNFTDGLALTFQ